MTTEHLKQTHPNTRHNQRRTLPAAALGLIAYVALSACSTEPPTTVDCNADPGGTATATLNTLENKTQFIGNKSSEDDIWREQIVVHGNGNGTFQVTIDGNGPPAISYDTVASIGPYTLMDNITLGSRLDVSAAPSNDASVTFIYRCP